MATEAYTFKKACRNKSWGTCSGCDNCKNSWPAFDSLKWLSAEKMCRCEPAEEVQNFVYGDACPNLYDGLCGADCHSCIEATDSSGAKECRCAAGEIRQVVWGVKEAGSLNAGLCGDSCKECRWSWESSDSLESIGATANYRCRNW
mmetsp:Transcript_13782/g.17421  ORF Transcript_13782/g.17421 Transcript_13782/m.17421 type:complete len:146 (-) Transcript_13782:85-522(-)